MTSLHIVALGSSFAAGPGIEPIIDKGAWRSGNNYAHLVAQKLNARLTDLSRSGATLLQILGQQQGSVLWRSDSTAQLAALPPDADIVTLTAGGNDMNYSGGMITDAVKAAIHAVPLIGRLVSSSAHQADEIFSKEEVAARLVRVIDRIKEFAPKASIYLVEYQTVFGPDAAEAADNPLNEQQTAHYRRVAESLQGAYEDAVKTRPETRLVRVAEASKDHGVGSLEPWVIGFSPYMLLRGEVPYHPNAAGHRAVADLLYKEIVGSQCSQG